MYDSKFIFRLLCINKEYDEITNELTYKKSDKLLVLPDT